MVEAEEISLPRSLQRSLPPEIKAPPIPTPPHLPSNDASSHHDDELDRSPSASQTSRPSSPVSSIAGDGKGPGEGPVYKLIS